MRGLKQFLAMGLAALLVFSTLASDYMVASAEEGLDEFVNEVVEEGEEIAESTEASIEADEGLWEPIPEEEENQEKGIDVSDDIEEPNATETGIEENGTIVSVEVGRIEYKFINDDGSEWGESQIVKNGDTLYEPEVPASTKTKEGTTYVFAGWYYTDENGELAGPFDAVNFDNEVSGIADGVEDTVTLIANYIEETDPADPGAAPGEKLDKCVTFDTKGGSLVDPVYVAEGETASKPADPIQAGFKFEGWYADKACSVVYTFTEPVTEDITVYANWTELAEGETTAYKVVYRLQNVDDDEYTVDSIVEMEGVVGELPTVLAPAKDGFKDPVIKKEPVKADGSTVIYVDYARNDYEITFYKITTKHPSYLLNHLTIHARYGADISSLWPSERVNLPEAAGWNSLQKSQANEIWQVGDPENNDALTTQVQISIDRMPAHDQVFYWYSNGPATKFVFECYVQDLNDESKYGSEPFRIISYTTDSAPSVWTYKRLANLLDIPGFVCTIDPDQPLTEGIEYEKITGSATKAKYTIPLYFKRVSDYKLTFKDSDAYANKVLDTKGNMKFEASLAGTYAGPALDSLHPGYIFDGWYENPMYTGNEYKLDEHTMPASDLTLFAKWKAADYTVRFFDTDGETKLFADQTAVYNTLAKDPGVPEKDGYVFSCWKDKATGARFSLKTPIRKNTDLIAVWTYDVRITVVYMNGSAEVAREKYLGGTYTRIHDGVTAGGKVFLGWSYAGSTYYPGKSFSIPKKDTNGFEIVFYALFGDKPDKTELIYVANNPTGDTETISSIKNNSTVIIKTVEELGFSYAGYEFTGWNDAGGKPYKPGDRVVVDNIGENTLTAQWRKLSAISFDANDGTASPAVQRVVGGVGTDLDPADVAEPKRDGYSFQGWFTDREAGEEVAISGLVFADDEVTYYAQWEKIRTSVTVTVKGSTKTTTYNGLEQSVSYEVVSRSDSSYTEEDFSYNGKAAVTGTDAGTYTETLDIAKFVNNNDDFTVTFALAGGDDAGMIKLVIDPAVLTVTTPSESKPYDGEPLTADGKISGFVNNETATLNMTGTQTAIGSSDNTYTIVWDGTAKEGNYTVSDSVGLLTVFRLSDISKEEIVIQLDDVVFTYDGKAHGTVLKEEPKLPKGYTLEMAASGTTATHVTLNDNRFPVSVPAPLDKLVIRNAQGEDVTNTGELNIKVIGGSITINPIALKVTMPEAQKVYDGTPLTADGTLEGAFAEGESAELIATGSQTEVGYSDNTYEIRWGANTLADDYTVSDTIGKLIVKQSEEQIVVVTTGGTFIYDGELHGATVSVSALPDGYTLETAQSDALAVDVTPEPVKADCDRLVIKSAAGEDVTSTLDIMKVPGTIKINPARLSLVIPDVTKEYDAVEITAPKAVLTGLVAGETLDVVITSSMKNVKRDAAGNPVGVEIEYELGWKKETENKLLNTAFNLFNATISSAAKESNYVLDVKDGKMMITPATLTVTTQSAARIYNGKALTADGKYEGLKGSDEIHFTVTGSQTKVGTSVNTYEILWLGALESNYNVVEDLGTLTVNAAPATPSEEPAGDTPAAGDDTVTTIPDEPAPTASAADVLGAKRGVEADASSVLGASREQSVLGARRGAQTGDENEIARYFMMMGISVSFAGLYTIARRKKRKAAN